MKLTNALTGAVAVAATTAAATATPLTIRRLPMQFLSRLAWLPPRGTANLKDSDELEASFLGRTRLRIEQVGASSPAATILPPLPTEEEEEEEETPHPLLFTIRAGE
jgi:hypothetical protein